MRRRQVETYRNAHRGLVGLNSSIRQCFGLMVRMLRYEIWTPPLTSEASSRGPSLRRPHRKSRLIVETDSARSPPSSNRTWQDSTATPEALALEDLVGGPAALSYLTGGRGTSRSTASQILKLRHTDPTVLPSTSRISLVSSFLCSILTGKLQGIDESDAAGTRLFDVEGRKWDDKLCREAGGEDVDLRELMGGVELDGGKSLGTVSEWVSLGDGVGGATRAERSPSTVHGTVRVRPRVHRLPLHRRWRCGLSLVCECAGPSPSLPFHPS